jgi:hypothetical protein
MPMRTDHSPAFPSFRSSQISTAGPTELGGARIAGSAVRAVNIRAGLGSCDFGFVCDELGRYWLLELDIVGLRRAAAVAELVWSRIPGSAIWTGPFKMNVAKPLLSHRSQILSCVPLSVVSAETRQDVTLAMMLCYRHILATSRHFPVHDPVHK